MKNSVMTVREVARYLRMKPVTIYKHAQEGKLPAFKVGSSWRFKKKTIDGWIAGQEKEELEKLDLAVK
ncbi:MAG: helix-turn-helix domain-containing protein [Candidatus Omnitrophica bacterium]|nr:helix-turn-helix domain-containing protein [Candidatus Omnitrophota bacterium]